jgi:hypothetical protein
MAYIEYVSIDYEQLKSLYCQNQLSLPEVSKVTGVSQSKIRNYLLQEKLLRSRSDAIRLAASKGNLGSGNRGKKVVFSDQWKANMSKARNAYAEVNSAGVSLKPNGYIEITRGENKGRSVHVVAMELFIGRRLRKNEVVHHKDENKQNNALENLELMTKSQHAVHHGKINSLNIKRNENGKFK